MTTENSVKTKNFSNRNNRRRDFRQEKPKDEFDSKLLDLSRVTRVSAGGKQMRFRSVVVVGNGKGKIGVGVSKGLDVPQSIEKATKAAKKNIITVPIVKGTVPHEVQAKYGSAKILLKPQIKGKGLVAGGTVRILCALAGIQDVSSKVIGKTSNKLNNAMATIEAFKIMKTRKQPLNLEKKEEADSEEEE
ncbi:MAG: 30S ribosomal protein S5 [Candidatus Paceibacterota bacterium]|jgi:small subunit ribosomal protein S5